MKHENKMSTTQSNLSTNFRNPYYRIIIRIIGHYNQQQQQNEEKTSFLIWYNIIITKTGEATFDDLPVDKIPRNNATSVKDIVITTEPSAVSNNWGWMDGRNQCLTLTDAERHKLDFKVPSATRGSRTRSSRFMRLPRSDVRLIKVHQDLATSRPARDNRSTHVRAWTLQACAYAWVISYTNSVILKLWFFLF